MAPRKKAAGLPLAGCRIAISGKFSTSQAEVQKKATALGAAIDKNVNAGTDVLLSTQTDCSQSTTKIIAAQKFDVPIVTIDWLHECDTNQSKEDTTDYLISTSQSTSNGKKRAASPDPSSAAAAPTQKKSKVKPDSQAEAKTILKFGESSIVKSRDTVISPDEECPLQSYRIYVGDDGVVFDAALNQTNASNNNNKFYRVQLLHDPVKDDYKTWTRWGRVGDRGQTAVLGSGAFDDAKKNYEKKFKDKSGLSWDKRTQDPIKGKYAYVEKSYAPDSDDDDAAETAADDGPSTDNRVPPKSTLAVPVQSLMQLIFNQQYMNDAMSDLNYDANKLPLGKLSKGTIKRGFQVLKDLSGLFQAAIWPGGDIEDLSNRFYSLIPHNFGRQRPPIIDNADRLKKELELLESLSDMKEAAELMKKDLKNAEQVHMLDRQFKGLGLNEMSVLEQSSTEFQELQAYLVNTVGATHGHHYKVESIFRIERNGELDRFRKSQFSKIQSDRRLLWHGSRTTNFGGILSQGLRIAPPEAPVSGYMFGKGIYLADMASKSANYCNAHSSGGHALLLLCEAELGKPMQELTDASYTAGDDAIASGKWSTWGKGQTAPPLWKDAGCVHPSLAGVRIPDTTQLPTRVNTNAYLMYNEYIAYDVAQVNLRYLLRVKM